MSKGENKGWRGHADAGEVPSAAASGAVCVWFGDLVWWTP